MPIAGVGVDVVEIDRFAAVLERRPRLAERCFTPAEAAYCRSRRFPPQHFAARFAAKEAVGKALRHRHDALARGRGRPRAGRAHDRAPRPLAARGTARRRPGPRVADPWARLGGGLRRGRVGAGHETLGCPASRAPAAGRRSPVRGAESARMGRPCPPLDPRPPAPPRVHAALRRRRPAREPDRRATEDHCMPSILLMERAGLATAEAVLAGFPAPAPRASSSGRATTAVTGCGRPPPGRGGLGRGGDGPRGRRPTPDAASMARSPPASASRSGRSAPARPAGAASSHALLGTGAQGAPRGGRGGGGVDGPAPARRWWPVDVPSGSRPTPGRGPAPAVRPPSRSPTTATSRGPCACCRAPP